MQRPLIRALMAPLILICVGCCCTGWTKNYPVKGRVVVGSHEIVESYLLTSRLEDLDGEHKPVSGAKIYLAYDRNGENRVTGYETRSDEKGFYEIDTEDIPPAQNSYNDYFLIIEKDGYYPIKHEMGFRFMSRYLNNTAVLKPVAKR